jgi:Domain of unknown function (DUF4390)
MPRPSEPPSPGLGPSPGRRRLLIAPIAACAASTCLVMAGGAVVPATARANTAGIEIESLRLHLQDGALSLEFIAGIQLPATVESALQKGVPVHFVAQADVLRYRWYWRDLRVARLERSWRLAFQPLTSVWRVGTGGLNQSYSSLRQALAAISRMPSWRLVDLDQIEPDVAHRVEFAFRLDVTQLPGPMQIGLTGQGDWQLGIRHTLRLE